MRASIAHASIDEAADQRKSWGGPSRHSARAPVWRSPTRCGRTWETDFHAARPYAFQVMKYIWASIPGLLQNLRSYLLVEPAELLRGHEVLS